MKRLKLVPLFLAVLMLASCAPVSPLVTDGPPQSGAKFTEGMVLSAPDYPKAIGYDDFDAKHAAREEIDETFLEAVRSFSIRSAALALREAKGKNALYSPASLFFALTMATAGAAARTREQFLGALGVDDALFQTETGKLFRQLYFDNEFGSFKVYNSAWLDGRAKFDQNTLKTLAENYYAECIAADFTGTAYKEQIASWISKRTDGLLGGDPESFTLDPETLMALINTLYYKDQWISQFSADRTAAADFHNADSSITRADFMNSTRSGGFDFTDAFVASSLQLKNGSLRFILPNEGFTPEAILSDEALFEDAVNGAAEGGYGEIVWQIPKFDYEVELDLADTLKAMGITDAFSSELANFSLFSSTDALFLSSVKQGSKIAIDENGIEAASYTDLAFAGSGMPTDRAEMVLDKPFLYVVSVGGMPVFVGIVNDMNG